MKSPNFDKIWPKYAADMRGFHEDYCYSTLDRDDDVFLDGQDRFIVSFKPGWEWIAIDKCHHAIRVDEHTGIIKRVNLKERPPKRGFDLGVDGMGTRKTAIIAGMKKRRRAQELSERRSNNGNIEPSS
ncbi:MAG: hypothetical protein HQL37_13750 [Alphaproteobacteria bacterium]|nr:hypothetical protein [Alphaproteobacteria bacterium]